MRVAPVLAAATLMGAGCAKSAEVPATPKAPAAAAPAPAAAPA
ncbi:thioredoxin, partial [Corallococcus sp. AB032C]